MDFIKKYMSHEEYEVKKTPNVSLCLENNGTKHLHYTKKRFDDEYLTFEALESGTFTLTIGSDVTTGDVTSVSYSLDNGETWTTTNNVQGQKVTITTPTVNAGDEVLWKGNAVRMANGYSWPEYLLSSEFSSTGEYNVRGNIMSLLYGDAFDGEISLSGKSSCFYALFHGSRKLKNAKKLLLPATILEAGCYNEMFNGCTGLTTAPELPATTLASNCYASMFSNCSSLTAAPELPATTLANYCYSNMFYGCASLTTAPELPATTLTSSCYYYMFQDCSSLTTAPELPATTLAIQCYGHMFNGCTNLTVAPELPATILKKECYYGMFNGCTSLTVAPELPATTLADSCYSEMFKDTNLLPDCTNINFASQSVVASGGLKQLFAGTNITDNDLMRILPLNDNNKYYLPATTLANSCYWGMFRGCKNLVTAPELPATTLANTCYDSMFSGCTSLTTAPELRAISLPEYCYNEMFYGCTKLNYIKALFLTDMGESSPATYNWVYGVAQSGTFFKNKEATWDVVGVNGVPVGWRIIYEEDEGGDDPEPVNRYIAIDDFVPEFEEDCDYDIECVLETYAKEYDFGDVDNYQCGIYLYNGEYVYDGDVCYIWEMIDANNPYSSQVAFILTDSRDYSGRTLKDGVLTYPVITSLNEDLEDNYHGGGAKTEQFIVKQWDE